MKTERLMGITLYLLNHDSVTAKQLSDKFDVSIRTIQRDIEALCLAGIPLSSAPGVNGGYSIIPEYKISSQFVKNEDYEHVVIALKSLLSSYGNKNVENTLNKYLSLTKNKIEQHVFLDYGVSKENSRVQVNIEFLEEAVSKERLISFDYVNSNQKSSKKLVQPLAIHYKWYAWYLLAYDVKKNDYRTYKVARMSDLQYSNEFHIPKQHGSIEKILSEQEKKYISTCDEIEIWFKKDSINLIKEFFPDERITKNNDGEFTLHLHVPVRERLWKALLLSFGDSIKIIKPLFYRQELIDTAKKFLSNYDI